MKLLNTNDIPSVLSKQKKLHKKIVLAGGCFDVLHKGHVEFLKAAKKEGEILIVFLESDENIRKKKGTGRPINSFEKRLAVLSTIKSIDYIVPLSGVTKKKEYDRLMFQIKPDIVAVTKGDKNINKRTIQCRKYNAELKQVIDRIEGISTTALVNEINS